MSEAGSYDMTAGTDPSLTLAGGNARIYPNSSGIPVWKYSGVIKAILGGRILLASNPGDPNGTTDTTGKMMGLAGSFTPAVTGDVLACVTGTLSNSTASAGDGAKVQLSYGTSTAPSNGGALAGTAVGSIIQMRLERATASDPYPFICIWPIGGLTLATAYWLDVRLAALTGGTAVITGLSMFAIEL